MNIQSVYFFNSLAALEAANGRQDGKFMFFYDGSVLEDAPSNCINVPISSFYDFFLQTTYPQASQLNFDGVNFSDDIKSQITSNITQTIKAINNQKIEIINSLLPAEIDDKNVQVMIFSFLKHLVEGADEKATAELIIKLLNITTYLQSHQYEQTQQILNLQTQLSAQINTQDMSMNNIFLTFILKQFQDKTEFDKNREECLQKISDYDGMQDIFTNFRYVKYTYKPQEFKIYVQIQAKLLFKDDFFDLDIIQQKKNIYKFFYATNYAFDFFEDFKEMYFILQPLYLKAMELNQDELVMYLYYPLQFSWNGVAQTQEEHKYFNDEVERPLEKYVKNTLIDKYKLKPNTRKINPNQKKIKVALLVHRILNLSVNAVMMSLLEAIKKNPDKQYEFIVYDMNVMELMGSETYKVDELKQLGFKYVDLHSKFHDNTYAFYSIMEKALKVRKLLIEDKIDILIGYHNRAEYNFLFTSRTAPKQIYWSHGNNEYDLENIDKRISHFSPKNTIFDFEIFNMPVDISRYDPYVDISKVEKAKQSYSQDSFILGYIGRLVKIDRQEYLESVAEIIKQNPHTIYLACGAGEQKGIKEKISRLGIENRFYFTGHIDPHIYGHVIDLFLSPFPIGAGEALSEYANKNGGKFFITMLQETQKERRLLAENLYIQNRKYLELACDENNISVDDYIQNLDYSLAETMQAFNSKEDYIDKAQKLIAYAKDNKKINELRKMMKIYNSMTSKASIDTIRSIFT